MTGQSNNNKIEGNSNKKGVCEEVIYDAMFSPLCPLLCKHDGVRSSWLLHQEVALGSPPTNKPIFYVCWWDSWGLFHFSQDCQSVCENGCDSSLAARLLRERAGVAFWRRAVHTGRSRALRAAGSRDGNSHAFLTESSWSGQAICFVPKIFSNQVMQCGRPRNYIIFMLRMSLEIQ